MTLCVLAGRDLRHIHDAIDASLLRRMGKVGRRLQNSGADGIAEISSPHALYHRTHGIEVEKITNDDFSPYFLQLLRPVVLTMSQRSDLMAARQQLFDRMAAGVACGARHQESLPGHERPPLKVTGLAELDVARLLKCTAVQLDVNRNQRV